MTLVRTYAQGDGSTAIGDSTSQVSRVVFGTVGADGADGADGQGVPVGGTTGQVLAKASATDYDTEWVDQTGGTGSVSSTDITDATTVGKAVLTATDAATARTAIGAGTSDLALGTTSTTALAGDTAIPSTPADIGAATAAQGALADSAVQPADLATVATSGSYDDLADQPTIPSTAADVGAVPTTRTVAGHALSADVTLAKADVGLGNVDNTADTAKPVSTAQQTALDFKAPLASPALTGTPTAPTAASGTNDTQIATTAYVDSAVSAGGGGGSSTDVQTYPMISGTYYGDPWANSQATSTTIPVDGRLFFHPFPVSVSTTFDQLAVEAVSAGTAKYRLGIYDSDPTTGMPRHVVAGDGQVDCVGIGARTLTISATLTPGLYWLGELADVTGSGSFRSSGAVPLNGRLGWSTVVSGSAASVLLATGVTAGALPDPAPAPSISTTTSNLKIFARVA